MQWLRYLGYVVLLTVGGAARRIPDNIMIGTAVSSYQVEGAYNITGRRLFVDCRFAYYIINKDLGDRENTLFRTLKFNVFDKVKVPVMKRFSI